MFSLCFLFFVVLLGIIFLLLFIITVSVVAVVLCPVLFVAVVVFVVHVWGGGISLDTIEGTHHDHLVLWRSPADNRACWR